MSTETTTAIALQSDFQLQFQSYIEPYLIGRGVNSPEFTAQFNKVANDMLFSQSSATDIVRIYTLSVGFFQHSRSFYLNWCGFTRRVRKVG